MQPPLSDKCTKKRNFNPLSYEIFFFNPKIKINLVKNQIKDTNKYPVTKIKTLQLRRAKIIINKLINYEEVCFKSLLGAITGISKSSSKTL